MADGYDINPLEGINVYLFTGSGSYQGVYQVTDANGQVTFNVPEKDYKARADYLSQQHWSDVFSWQDVGVVINHGTAILHVTHNGQDLYDVPVYLFTASGSYLSRLERTDSSGQVQFLLPADSYKFRVDYDGTQYWSGVISLIPHEENNIDLQLELLAALTNNPNPVRFDGVPPNYEPEKIMIASLGSIRGLLVHSVVGQTTGGQELYYFINDHLGTPQKLLNKNADIVWSADYKPFGEADVYVNTYENNFRFPGQYFDQETGLHYNYYRYYDPKLGRYLTSDPIGVYGGINLFSYVLNNPANVIDPLGLYRDVGGGFGVTAAIVSVSVSIHTDTCCDEQGRKHIRTIQTVCVGLELGLGLKGSHGSSASLSDDQKPKKCPKMFDDSGWYSEDSGVWGAIIIGRSYSTSSGTGGWKVGLGGGWSIYSGCRNDIIKDVISGDCCDKK